MASYGGTVSNFSTTEEFFIQRPVTISNSSASTGTLTIQSKVGQTWDNPAVLGTVAAGAAQVVDSRLIFIRCVVSGSVNYEIR